MFLQQQLRFKLLHYIQKLFSASNGSGIGVFHRQDAQPGTRMPTKRAGGWLMEGANGRGTTTVVAGAGDFPCPLSMLLQIEWNDVRYFTDETGTQRYDTKNSHFRTPTWSSADILKIPMAVCRRFSQTGRAGGKLERGCQRSELEESTRSTSMA